MHSCNWSCTGEYAGTAQSRDVTAVKITSSVGGVNRDVVMSSVYLPYEAQKPSYPMQYLPVVVLLVFLLLHLFLFAKGQDIFRLYLDLKGAK